MQNPKPTTVDSVHGHAMRINRSVDEAYATALRDGFALLDVAIDEQRLKGLIRDDSCGALATFEGWVRNHNNANQVAKLTYYGLSEGLNDARGIEAGAAWSVS